MASKPQDRVNLVPFQNSNSSNYSTSYATAYSIQVPAQVLPPVLQLRSPQEQRDGEANKLEVGFSDKSIKHKFICRIYFILALQFLSMLGVICCFIFTPFVRRFVAKYLEVYVASAIIFLAIYIFLACAKSIRKMYPVNLILLLIFTLSMGVLAGVMSSFHRTAILLTSMAICATSCTVIAMFFIQTRFELSRSIWFVTVISLVLFLFGMSCIAFYNRIMTAVYSGLIALFLMLILAIDTQSIMGDRDHRFILSPEEYITGVLFLHFGIFHIFLRLIGVDRIPKGLPAKQKKKESGRKVGGGFGQSA